VDKLALGRLAVQALEYRIAWPESAPISILLTPQYINRETVSSIT
jgi:hypothetical protein